MAQVIRINSGKGLVTLTKEDLIDYDLIKWIRTHSHGYGHSKFLSVQPIEAVAAKLYKDKYPSSQVKIAEKLILQQDGSVDVILKVAEEFNEGYYNTHNTTKLVRSVAPKGKVTK